MAGFGVGVDTLGGPLGGTDMQVPAPTFGPCDTFVTADDLAAHDECESLNASGAKLTSAAMVASATMWALTGRQFSGGCRVTLRPWCGMFPSDIPAWAWREWGGSVGGGGYGIVPGLVTGNWYNFGYGGGQGSCLAYDCGGMVPRLDLGHYPVTEVQVIIDGIPLDGAAYRLDGWRWLTRVDGLQWPSQNSLTLPDGPGVWSISIVSGWPVPDLVKQATLDLAVELVKASCGVACSLPLGQVQNMNRQGINYTFAKVFDAVKDGRTGIYTVDLAVTTVNPARLVQRPRILAPEVRPHPTIGSQSGSRPVVAAPPDLSLAWLIELAADPEGIISGNVHRDANDVITTADVVWPDGVTGTFTTLAVSTAGDAVDSYRITHSGQTFTQPTVTRDVNGAVTYRPAIVVT